VGIAFVAAVWGEFWDLFGQEFLDSLAAMNPAPDEAILVCDQDYDAPAWLRQIRPRSPVPMWDWFNEGVEACSSEWVMVGSVDDVMLSDGLADLDLKGDFISTACLQNGVLETCPSPESWERILDLDQIAIWTGAVFRRDVFLRFPWRRVEYPDWMQWLELKKAGASISFDRKPRFIHRRHEKAHTTHPSPHGDDQIRLMRKWLRSRHVTPGVDWPPRGILRAK
jgi:hypothetical protein